MFRRFLAIASLTILAFLAVTATGRAQSSRQGTYIYQDSPRGYSYAPSAVFYSTPATATKSRAYYPGAEPDKVLVNVTIPADAKLTFQGAKTTQTGTVRHFLSPSITAGYRYAYSVQATWMENGQAITKSRSFEVQPGDVVQIVFSRDDVTVRAGELNTRCSVHRAMATQSEPRPRAPRLDASQASACSISSTSLYP